MSVKMPGINSATLAAINPAALLLKPDTSMTAGKARL
jgi:hypothetical protein